MTVLPDWASWIVHFFMIFVLCRWSGIKWQWALIIIVAIEVWECSDWAGLNFDYWFLKIDTWADMLAGVLAVLVAGRANR